MAHMIPRYHSFSGVLHNGYDQVLMRRLLKRFIPTDVKKNIVREFNAATAARNKFVSAMNKK